jgi:hypothetical protein
MTTELQPSNYSKGCEWMCFIARSNHYVTALNSPTDLTFSNAAVVYGYHNNGICNGYQWSRSFNVLDYRNNISYSSFIGPITTGSGQRLDFPNLLPGIIPLE